MKNTTRPVEFTLPPSGALLSYKVLYVLCTLQKQSNLLKATHLTCCLSAGREPVWGVWTIGGKFQRFFNRRVKVEEAYPKLVWRRLYGTWTMVNAGDMTDAEKHSKLAQIYHEGGTLTGGEVALASNVVAFRNANGRK